MGGSPRAGDGEGSRQGAMHRVCTNLSPEVHHAGSLPRLQEVILVGLVVLLVAGCQNEATLDNQAADNKSGKTSEATGQTHDGDKKDQKRDETAQTLGLLTKLIENCNSMLRKLAGRQEAYASAGNAEGERLMAQAGDNVKEIKSTASSLKRDVQAADTGKDVDGEAFSIQIEVASQRDGPPQSAVSTDQAVASNSQLAQEKLEDIEKATDELEENLAEAQRCCDLPASFLDSNLQELHTQTTSIQTLTKQIDFEKSTAPSTTAEPTEPSTAPPTASPTPSPAPEYTEQ